MPKSHSFRDSLDSYRIMRHVFYVSLLNILLDMLGFILYESYFIFLKQKTFFLIPLVSFRSISICINNEPICIKSYTCFYCRVDLVMCLIVVVTLFFTFLRVSHLVLSTRHVTVLGQIRRRVSRYLFWL